MNSAAYPRPAQSKRQLSLALFILYVGISFFAQAQEGKTPQPPLWNSTSIQSAPATNQAQQLRPTFLSQFIHSLAHGSGSRHFNIAQANHIIFIFTTKSASLDYLSFQLVNQSLHSQLTNCLSKVLRL
jgi:hypothetical protein